MVPPWAGCVKINVDAAWEQSKDRCRVAAVARDEDGKCLGGRGVAIDKYFDSLAAELGN